MTTLDNLAAEVTKARELLEDLELKSRRPPEETVEQTAFWAYYSGRLAYQLYALCQRIEESGLT